MHTAKDRPEAVCLGHNFVEATVEGGPGCGVLAHPTHCFDYLDVRDLDRLVEDWFVMGDPVSETSKRVEALVIDISKPATAFACLSTAARANLTEAIGTNRRVGDWFDVRQV